MFFFFSSRRRHTRCSRDWSSDVCSSDLVHDDAFAVREHQSVGRPEVNGEVGRKQTKHRPHVVTVLIHPYFPPRRKTPRRPAGKALRAARSALLDRKSTRLNSSHGYISYAV